MKKGIRFSLSTTQWIMLSFFIVILIGSLLLFLPISVKEGQSVTYLDALFTATSATCVTGLVTVPTVTTWSIFGQIVILILIQIGGLGVVTILSGMMMLLHRRIGLGDRLLIQDAMNLNTLSGLLRFIKKVLIGTLLVEGVGALLYMIVLVPDFGVKGIWLSVFNSVSAFCNAGIDIIAENSLEQYVHQPLINLVTCGLIILGGLGYVVWWDVIRVIGTKKMGLKHLTLHSKIVISFTAALILLGTSAILILEYNNPNTIGTFSFGEKLMASFFQSVTTRTAGFATLPQQNLTPSSSLVSILLMFIGGSPVGTAGGVKTVTIAVLCATAYATVKNKNDVSMFGRNLSKQAVGKAIAVSSISFVIVFTSTVLLSVVTDASVLDIIYETVSATATVGLSRSLTAVLNEAGKVIIIATMYLGRIGPISLFIALNSKKDRLNLVKNPTEEISVG